MDENQKDIIIPQLAQRVVNSLSSRGLIIRIMGACAIRLHSPKYAELHRSFRKLSDVDFATYYDQLDRVHQALVELGFKGRGGGYTVGVFVKRRILFYKVNGEAIWTDVFADSLEMNHVINFKGRLEVDSPTLPLAELFLQKAQIVKINEKDLKDIAVLLLEHDVGNHDRDVINGDLIAEYLSKDWGFYYTVTTNLDKLKRFVLKWPEIDEDGRKLVAERIDKLQAMIEERPKSLGWKMRAKIGTKKIWYNPVEEVERAPHLESLSDDYNSREY